MKPMPCLAVLLLLAPIAALADTASAARPISNDLVAAPPASWQGHFHPIPRIDRGNMDPVTDQRLDELRTRVGTALNEGAPERPGAALIEPLADLCAMYDAMGTRTSAEICYENLRRADPDEFRWSYQQAWMDLRSGRHDEALILLDVAASLRDDYPPLTLRRGEALYGLNRLDEARAALESALGEAGLRARAEYFLGQIALLRRDFASARAHFETALERAPQADAVHYPLAQALRALGERDAAREHLALKGKRLPKASDQFAQAVATAASGASGAKAQFYEGMHAKEADDLDLAISKFAAGLELDPDNRAARISYARLLYLDGDQAGARRELQRVTDGDHPSPMADFLLGLLYDADGDDKRARAYYQDALRTDPEMPGAKHYLGQLLYRLGDYRAALPHLQFAAESDPNNLPARLLAWAARYRDGEDPARLISELEIAREAAPTNPMLNYALIRLLAAHGDAKRALALAEELLANVPIPPLQAALGVAEAANGNRDAAIEALRKAADAANWMGQTDWAAELDKERANAEAGQAPGNAWPLADPLFRGHLANATPPFRDYPAGAAY